ncbi:MAG: cupin domain-containing protein [Micropruina sp.]|nr:cupin domain-containing protein [Micropruina sp.]
MQQQPTLPTSKGPADRFIGDAYVDMIVANPEAGFSVGMVHFTPGCHNAWHSHAAGQMLHCTEGLGVVVTEDEVIVLRPGVTVWTPPNQRHWHGAVPDRLMSHLAMSAAVPLAEGQEAVTWQEHVSDADYLAAAAAATTAH